ncbi:MULTISPECIES: amino acid deaminase [Pseudonocardia]|uniref:D-serine deaminase-like pyridoxal phosphate-dependent protein n=1 Tax=Pseudonocardia alni TaxID=33907 RepID=A0A852W0Z5_PSEA5|nr:MULTISPECIES: amino acid deaminase [Pseudonocardia]MCO7191851.1 amino acid deaminase [Pseudonocardia sp. McavD-2-B]NYG02020.1 D-serine deaminase-like pyridoxal phosphate-dependent protein [Pseudonocardia antarctica]
MLRYASLGAERPGPYAKSVPPLPGTVDEWLAGGPRLSDLATPVLTLDRAALHANAERMAGWCAAHGVDLAPHGKTTMAPALWDLQLRHGAWGITVATPWQARIAIDAGVRRVLLANALVDPAGVRAVAAARDADPDLEVLSWVDSVDAVTAMTTAAGSPARPLAVVVELGAPGGRTGARTLAEAERVASAVVASPVLALAGVGGYEGALAHDPSEASLATVRAYLDDLAELHRRLAPSYGTDEVVVTAGGSAYFDQVVAALAGLADTRTRVVLRSGAYLVHDDGFYRGISPLARDDEQRPFRSAMHVTARVVSTPEPGLALLDAGKRDVPFDEGLPEPQRIADDLGSPSRPLTGTVTAVNDQHAFLRTEEQVRIGQVVRLGLSHPCTAFDKWRWIPVLDGTDPDPQVVELVRTFF